MDEHGWLWRLELKETGEFYLANLIGSTMAVQEDSRSYELQGDSLVLRYDTLDATLHFTVDGGNLIFQDDLSQYEAKLLAGWIPSALFGDGTVFVHNEGMEKQE